MRHPSNADNRTSAHLSPFSRSVLPWLLAVFFVPLYVFLNILWIQESFFYDYALADFHIYHEALQHAAGGLKVYDFASPMPFLYPPFFLILLWPLGWLSEPAAMTVWLYLQNALLVISLVTSLAIFRRLGWFLVPWTIILFTGFSPVMINALYGQTNLLYLALLSLFVLGYVESATASPRSRLWEIVAALALSAAISIRMLPLALLVLAVIQRRYRFALWTAAFVGIEAVAAGMRVGFATEWYYFTSYIFHFHGLANMREISILSLARRLVPPPFGMVVFLAAVAAGLAVFIARLYGPTRRLASRPALPIAFVAASMALFSPLLEYHHYTILLLAYVLVLGELARLGRLNLTAALPIFGSWAVVSSANHLSHWGLGPIVAYAALLGAALIWGYSARLVRQEGRVRLVEKELACPPPREPIFPG